jgi:photosystem II stability/assembly factor-like uncharacterized protein
MVPRALVLSTALALGACGGQEPEPAPLPADADPGLVHIHGLGVDPADGALFIATHTGLFRAERDQSRATRVAERYQDTMGFTVVGPNRFLGSGHPDGRENLPPFLGLIESRDAGQSWRSVSLQGEVDFHVLEASGPRVYGFGSDFESREPRFLASADRGKTWERRRPPEPLLSLAIAPTDPSVVIASGEQGVYRSENAGETWRTINAPAAGLLAWNARGLFLAGLDGRVWSTSPPAVRWQSTAEAIGDSPAAWDSGPNDELLAALHDGTVRQSDDGGRTWITRLSPG